MENEIHSCIATTAPSPAEQNELNVRRLCQNVKTNFIALGALLYENKQKAYWSMNGWESFGEFLQSLGVGSISWCYRLIEITEAINEGRLALPDVVEMGVTNTALIIPSLKKGKGQELVELAKNASSRDLREALGYKMPENDEGCSIICPRCGDKIIGATWKRRTNEEHD